MSATNPPISSPVILGAVAGKSILTSTGMGDSGDAPIRVVARPPGKRLKPARAWRWPLIIVGLLATHAVAMVCVAVVASRDPAFVVRQNYYRDAVNWDKDRAAARSAVRERAAEPSQVKP